MTIFIKGKFDIFPKKPNFDENFLDRDDNKTQLTPSIDGSLFKCEYKIKINMNLDNIFGKNFVLG